MTRPTARSFRLVHSWGWLVQQKRSLRGQASRISLTPTSLTRPSTTGSRTYKFCTVPTTLPGVSQSLLIAFKESRVFLWAITGNWAFLALPTIPKVPYHSGTGTRNILFGDNGTHDALALPADIVLIIVSPKLDSITIHR